MKKFFTLLVLAACCAAMTWGCSDDKYDDTEIRQEIENLKQEIASMKEQVNSLKTIIDALNENKFITNYTEAADGSCTITFNDGKTITLHCARHTFGTLLVSAGGPMESIAKMMGHTNIRTTQGYAKVTDDKISEDMDRLMEKRNSMVQV